MSIFKAFDDDRLNDKAEVFAMCAAQHIAQQVGDQQQRLVAFMKIIVIKLQAAVEQTIQEVNILK